jgi:hypothetical protein
MPVHPRLRRRAHGAACAIALLALVFMLAWSATAHAGACSVAGAKTWTGLAGDDSWFTPGNWSGNTVPTASTNVCINVAPASGSIGIATGGTATAKTLESHYPLAVANGSTLTLASTSEIDSDLLLDQGTINGAGSFTVTGLFHWDGGGTLDGAGTTTIPSGGQILIDNDFDENARTLSGGRDLTIAAGAEGDWNGPFDIYMQTGSILTVGGTFNIGNDQTIFGSNPRRRSASSWAGCCPRSRRTVRRR